MYLLYAFPSAWNYNLTYFQSIFDDVERLLMKTIETEHGWVIADIFNLSLGRRDRGRIMIEFCMQFQMDIANEDTDQEDIHKWTFKSSISGLHRLEYILHTKNLRSFDAFANYQLDLGSDHRNVSTSLEFIRPQESQKKLHISFKG